MTLAGTAASPNRRTLRSSRPDNSVGTSNSTRKVENASPNEIDTAIGIRNWACSDVSNNSGSRPAMVVSDVSRTARSRWQAASTMASLTAIPFCRSCL